MSQVQAYQQTKLCAFLKPKNVFCYQKVVFCTFGKIKKHEMESGFDIKNHG